MDPQKVTYIGKVDYRNKSLTFGIKERDRTRHMYVIGKTGMGKSTLLEGLAIQDINNGEGICVIDPHGSMAEKLLDFIPASRVKDVVYFAPFDAEYPIGLNMIEKVPYEKRHLVVNGLMAAFKKIWVDAWSARMEYILNNILLALLENEGQTLLGVNRMLTDKVYRKQIVANIKDPVVRDFWVNEYANYTDRFAQEAAPAIQNKVGQFFGNPLIRNIIGQQHTSFDPRKLMDEKKILIVNLSKGKVGEGNANLLGSLLITKIYLSAMSRADVGPYELEKLPPFYFYVDEFQNFANESFASILSEARKYNLALTVAHQYVEQMTDEVKAAVFGNVGTMITFRVGATDAEIFEKEYAPYFTMDDIVNLSAYQVYLRLMIDGVGSKPFSARMLPPSVPLVHSNATAIIAHSRQQYGRNAVEVEKEISAWYAPTEEEKKVQAQPLKDVDKTHEYQKPSVQKSFVERKGERRSIDRREISNHFDPRRTEHRGIEASSQSHSINSSRKRDGEHERKDASSGDTVKEARVQESANNARAEYKERSKDILFENDKGESIKGMSLKDALAKALQENKQEIHATAESVITVPEKKDSTTPTPTRVVKEVSEGVLKPLVEDKEKYE